MAYAYGLEPYPERVVGSTPTSPTRIELNGFSETELWAAVAAARENFCGTNLVPTLVALYNLSSEIFSYLYHARKRPRMNMNIIRSYTTCS